MAEPVQIPTHDGQSYTGFLHAPQSTPAPGLVMCPEIFGINQPLREIADRYAGEGFAVLVMDIFWRMQPLVDLGYDKESYKKAYAFGDAFSYDIGVRDMQSAITALRKRPECTGRVGMVGFCLGGTMAYLGAARTDLDAAVGYYGTRIHRFLNDGPKINRPLILHFGERDHTTPPEHMRNIIPSIADNQNVKYYIYPGVGHAFANHRRPDTYSEVTTQHADALTFAFFRRLLQPN